MDVQMANMTPTGGTQPPDPTVRPAGHLYCDGCHVEP